MKNAIFFSKNYSNEEIEHTDTIRIEHVVTGFWLHGQTGI